MHIWRKIYDDYCEGLLSIEPILPTANDEVRLKRLEEEFGVDPENKEKFENVFTELTVEAEMRGFYVGLKIALRLLSE